MAQICRAERRVLLYLDHDMVFIPINIREMHCSSCGLFLLNYIEYWTGDELSDNFTQRMVGYGKLPKYHQDPTTEELAKTLDCWPSMNYYITGCRYVLMPWKFNGCYTLFVINHVKKQVILSTLHRPKIGISTCIQEDAKNLRKNFMTDLLSYEDNLCRYVIPPNIQHRLIDIAKND
ncbi:hypothetical protein Zm00014a_000676 [Zea mays]|uniref:Uncharacterized protein n=1 Tax=Zea mays TaxID=4577 RepID=A0A3L6DUZ4_MAIZE|nr:hypothetical protein Zm00014a_000676 [Zea mays]